MIPEEVGIVHAPSGVRLGGSQRLADGAFASWRCGKLPSASLTSGLSLSARSSDVDLKEFLVQRGIYMYVAIICMGRKGTINNLEYYGIAVLYFILSVNGVP